MLLFVFLCFYNFQVNFYDFHFEYLFCEQIFYRNLIAILIQSQHLKVILVQMWLIWGIRDKTEIFLQFFIRKNISYENIWMNEIVSDGLIHILK